MTLSTKQVSIILLIVLASTALFFRQKFHFDKDTLLICAMLVAALMPSACYKATRLNQSEKLPQALFLSALIGILWFFIIEYIFQSIALSFAGAVACISYLVLRLK